jgi:hypothetical protein
MKFVSNGKITDVVKSGSLMHLLYCGLNPQSEIMYDNLRASNTYISLENGVVSWEGIHVFSKCSDVTCEICLKYKNKSLDDKTT